MVEIKTIWKDRGLYSDKKDFINRIEIRSDKRISLLLEIYLTAKDTKDTKNGLRWMVV